MLTEMLTAFLRDHPRIRGEHVKRAVYWAGAGGSSPHTRGALSLARGYAFPARIIPAYAGSTPFSRSRLRSSGDHPRIRGEHVSWDVYGPCILGSSPHTRGARPDKTPYRRCYGIIPAYAGSTPGSSTPAAGSLDHPRIRGEHAVFSGAVAVVKGSSPHTRGAQDRPERGRHGQGIIPAYAGSTTSCCCSSSLFSDHPRIRGEHVSSAAQTPIGPGSSPHTRGARLA